MTEHRDEDRDEAATTWTIGVRHRCDRCDRLAVVYDDEDRPLCARHATIFMTAGKDTPTRDDGDASA